MSRLLQRGRGSRSSVRPGVDWRNGWPRSTPKIPRATAVPPLVPLCRPADSPVPEGPPDWPGDLVVLSLGGMCPDRWPSGRGRCTWCTLAVQVATLPAWGLWRWYQRAEQGTARSYPAEALPALDGCLSALDSRSADHFDRGNSFCCPALARRTVVPRKSGTHSPVAVSRGPGMGRMPQTMSIGGDRSGQRVSVG